MSEGTATVCPALLVGVAVEVAVALPLPLWNVDVDVADSPSPSPICPRDVDFAQPGRQLSDGRS
jgi:hypothetical protein